MKASHLQPPRCLVRASDGVQPCMQLLLLLLLMYQPISLASHSSHNDLNTSLLHHAVTPDTSVSPDSLHLQPETETAAADMTPPAADFLSVSSPPSQVSSSQASLPSPSSSSPSLYSRYLLPAAAAALLSSVSAVCYLYYRYRQRAAASSFSAADFHSRPLLLQLRQGGAASRVQGLDWAVQSLRWDADGDCAHDFLGPFVFAADSQSGSTAAATTGQQGETAEKEAVTLTATAARKAPALTTAGRKGLRSRRKD